MTDERIDVDAKTKKNKTERDGEERGAETRWAKSS